jgi:hypothetical protein
MHGAYETGAGAISAAVARLVSSVGMRRVAIVVVLVAGCGSEAPPDPPPRVAAPDAGMRGGHGAEPDSVRVPEADGTAPEAVLSLAPAEAVSGGEAATVRLDSPVLRPTAIGRDKQGMARIRVSLEARVRCGDEVRPLTRYFPPPEIARPRIPPGVLVPTELTRSVRYALACPRGRPAAAEGTVWADATSAWETEASSAPIHFRYR